MKKKTIIILLLVVFMITGCGKRVNNSITLKNGEKVKIVQTAAKTVQYETFNNGLISMQIPKGWKVEIPPVDYIHYNFKVYNPEDDDYMFFFALKFEGYMKSTKARNWQRKWYPSTMFAKLPAISPQTSEAFFKVWNTGADYSNKEEVKYNYFKHINDFTVIEELGKDMVGGQF